MKYFCIILIIHCSSLFGVRAQTNLEHLYFRPDTFNTLSYNHDQSLVLIGRKSDCLLRIKDAKTNKYHDNLLKGNHAILLKENKGICTFVYDEKSDTTTLYWVNLKGEAIKEFVTNGEVNSIASALNGESLYVAIEYSSGDNYLEKLTLNTGNRYAIEWANLALNVVVFYDGKIGVGGPVSFLFNANEKFIAKRELPHLGYIKYTCKSDTIKILSAISDAAYLNIYDAKMVYINSISYEWPESEIDKNISLPDCVGCTPSVYSKFVDFDVSRDGKVFVAKDQNNKVFLLDSNGKRLRVFGSSKDWWFLHFISNNTFRYYNTSTREIVEQKI